MKIRCLNSHWAESNRAGNIQCLCLLLAAASVLPAASISTSAVCMPSFNSAGPYTQTGGGPGSSYASCSGNSVDHGLLWPNWATAQVSDGSVVASEQVYRNDPFHVTSTASYQETYNVVFYGGSGFGIFEPNFSLSGYAGLASAMATLDTPPVVTPFGGSGGTCLSFLDPPNNAGIGGCPSLFGPFQEFTFAFGQPVTFTVALYAMATDGPVSGTSSATFLDSFTVNGPYLPPPGPPFAPVPGATWDLEAVPEPSMTVPVALFLAIILATKRSRDRKEAS